jgi:thiamine pyrophosphokinase
MKNIKALIVANGETPSKQVINYLLGKGYTTIIAADGGLLHCKKLGIVPHHIVGDFDSITEADLKKYRRTSTIKHIARQTDTDLEKAIRYSVNLGFKDIAICGATGLRIDHTLGNISLLLRYGSKMQIRVFSKESIIIPVAGVYTFISYAGETISIFAFENRTKISTLGLKYPLDKESLTFGERESVSNEAVDELVSLKVTHGAAILVRDIKVVMKYDI